MKAGLGALTVRGRSFLAAGVAALASAFILGEQDLLRIAVLIVALPLLAALTVVRTRYRLGCGRRLEPARTPVGTETTVTLRLDNVTRLPTGLLLIEDQIPYALGGRPRFVLDRIEPLGTREISYRVRSDVRGRFRIGPLTVRIADPFGLVELVRSFSVTDDLIVTPEVVPLPHVRLSGEWTGGGESRTRSVAAAGDDDVAPREYRQGDDLRRVHWRSTARHGELMVRREEQQWQSRGALLLDTRRHAHRGEGPGSSFEVAVSAAASIGVHLSRESMGMRFVTDAGGVHLPDTQPGGALLDTLAVARASGNRDLSAGIAALRQGGGDGLIVAVLGQLGAEEARALARVRHGTITGVAVLLDVLTWSDRAGQHGSHEIAATVLRDAGWRVVELSAGVPLASVWAAAGGDGRVSSAPSGSPLAGGSPYTDLGSAR
ncbi:DUF58 domain-containing protein [Bailinhaonella thermotolerans]|uniref:DUF58 domain-containing protein n=1 Tax=Bailinhaonella thermotolerans TaxID=1070861 RepID=A0A3A4ANK8_9ACTN|nr:DUF58 domain-containing protein [Bailinhaonella thermotolerans]RJL31246.1 DUF58 domain-containing protein [Bailinhaonella thermotolerans]